MLRSALLFAPFLFSSSTFASHVAGGEITYECLGNNQYRLRYVFYRDCFGASLPNSATIDIYDINQNRLQRPSLPLINTTRLDGVAPSPCTIVPAVCLMIGEYEGIVTLPPRPGGYILSYDLCCRNSGIVNGPDGTAAYTTRIPDIALAACNSNPVFRGWPPVFICLGEEFVFDHSATDRDGDSLAYSICTPYESIVPSRPYPFGPGYSATDPMGGNSLTLDPVTGRMTVTPTRLGRHVVGICVSEYRNGRLINTTTRDFQLNVVACTPLTTASGLNALTNCNIREVTFFNNSRNGSTFFWDFGDGNTSTAENPVHVYGALGTYTATLIAINGTDPQCSDTTTLTVNVTECRPCGMNVQVTTVEGICNPMDGCYEIRYVHPCVSSSRISYPGVTISGGCGGGTISGGSAPLFDAMDITVDGVRLPTGATTTTYTYLGPASPCAGRVTSQSSPPNIVITFNAVYTQPQTGGARAIITGGTPPYTIQWTTTPTQTGDNAVGVNPGSYSVIVTDANGCVEVVTFMVPGRSDMVATPSATNVTACGANDGTLSVNVTGNMGPMTFLWTPGNYTTRNVSNVPPGTYTVLVTDTVCSTTATITVLDVDTINVTANITDITCPTDSNGGATASASGGVGPYTYSWNTTPPQTGPSVSGLGFGFYTVTATDQNGCTGTFSFTISGPVAMRSTIEAGHPDCPHGQGSATVNITGGTGPYTYSWNTTPPQTGRTANNLRGNNTYVVTITDANGCVLRDSVAIEEPEHLHIDLYDRSSITCAGVFTGSIFADISGGRPDRYNTTTIYDEPFNTNGQEVGCGSWHTDVSGGGPTDIMNTGYFFRTMAGGYFGARRMGAETAWFSRIIDISGQTNVTLNGDFFECGNMAAGEYIRAYYRINGGAEVLWFDQTGNGAVDCSLLPGTATGLSGNTVQIVIRVFNAGTREHRFDNIRVTGDVSGVLYNETFDTPDLWNHPDCEWWRDVKGPNVDTRISGAGGADHVETRNGVLEFQDTDGEIVWYSRTVDISSCETVRIAADFGFNGAAGAAKYIRGFYSLNGGAEVLWSEHISNVAANWPNGNPGTYQLDGLTGNTIRIIVRVNNTAANDIHTLDNVRIFCTTPNPNPYTYSWTCSPDNAPLVTGISPGLCTVTVTDSAGCSVQSTITIANPGVLAVNTTAIGACGGSNDGSATVNVSGGNLPYTYAWTCSPDNFQTVAGLTAGTSCTVTVTDSIGCTATSTVTIPANPGLTVDSLLVRPACPNDGAIDLQVTGGTPPFQFFWNNGATTQDIAGLTGPAFYTVSVFDANNCFDTLTVYVPYFCSPHTVDPIDGAACEGACGEIGAVHVPGPGGDFPPYTYVWTGGVPDGPGPHQVCPAQTTSYTVTVTDGRGITATATATVIIHPLPTVTLTPVDVLCHGGSDGSVTASPVGGTAPFTFLWNTTPPQSIPTIGGLPIGTYSVEITDANGCTASGTTTIGQPAELLLDTASTAANCGLADGSATVTPNGGTPPYTYSWNTAPPQTTPTATNLAGGSYDVIVTDANGCSATVTILVPLTDPAIVTVTHTDVSCNGGNDGTATASPSGGAPPYSFSWNTFPPQTVANATGLPAGAWTVTITDANGCTATATANVGEPSLVTLATSATPDPCQLGQGSTIVNASGGTPPYTYGWNTTPPQNTPSATNLPAGTYTVIVTDANGCSATANATVDSPAPLTTTTTPADVSCFGGSDGTATANPAGGTPPYTYSWNTTPQQTTQIASNLPPGSWTVTVTDANGCTTSADALVGEPAVMQLVGTPQAANCGLQDGTATVDPSGGTPPYTYSWNTTPPQTTQTATGLGAGTYTVTVTDARGCTRTTSVTVTTPTPGTLSVSRTDASCNGANDGTATVDVTGGNPPFTYAWNTAPVQTTPTATGLPAGTWTVTVTDGEGCVLTIQAVVGEPTAILPAATSTPTNCGMPNGSASVGATGGTPPYTWSWSTVPAQTTQTITGITAGAYTVTVIDANGCTATTSVTVADIPGPLADFTIADVCIGEVAAFVNTSTGQSTITSVWDFGDGNASTLDNPTHTYAGPGTYTVTITVTDQAGCSATRSRDITVHPIPVVAFSAAPTEGCAPVTAVFSNNNPLQGSTCRWTFGDGNTSTDCNGPAHTYPNGGCYDVTFTITSAAGCIGRQTRDSLICVTPNPVAYFTAEPNPAPDVLPIISFINGSSGATRYLWEFLGGNITSTLRDPVLDLTGADPGSYDACLRVWNDYGCVDSICRVFRITADPQVYVPNAFTPDGDGVNDIFRPIISGDGVEDYRFMVFNRWGELIFETNNPTMGWDGAYGGVMSQTGVYVWKLRFRHAASAQVEEFVGHVSLLR